MSFDNISFGKLAIIFIIAGVALVLAILGSSAISLFSNSITEEAEVKMKQEGDCIVEAEDKIPRMISDCLYNVNDTVLITYKTKQPSIEKHQLKQSNE
jgi:flagellar basal body-associated protein FliL